MSSELLINLMDIIIGGTSSELVNRSEQWLTLAIIICECIQGCRILGEVIKLAFCTTGKVLQDKIGQETNSLSRKEGWMEKKSVERITAILSSWLTSTKSVQVFDHSICDTNIVDFLANVNSLLSIPTRNQARCYGMYFLYEVAKPVTLVGATKGSKVGTGIWWKMEPWSDRLLFLTLADFKIFILCQIYVQ